MAARNQNLRATARAPPSHTRDRFFFAVHQQSEQSEQAGKINKVNKQEKEQEKENKKMQLKLTRPMRDSMREEARRTGWRCSHTSIPSPQSNARDQEKRNVDQGFVIYGYITNGLGIKR